MRFLGIAVRQFSFFDSIELPSGGFDALTYFGRVSIAQEPGVAPEPSTLLLVGMGAAGLLVPRARPRFGVTYACVSSTTRALAASQQSRRAECDEAHGPGFRNRRHVEVQIVGRPTAAPTDVVPLRPR